MAIANEFFGSGELFADGEYLGRVDGMTLKIAESQVTQLETLGYSRAAHELADRYRSLGCPVCEWPNEVIEDILDADVIS